MEENNKGKHVNAFLRCSTYTIYVSPIYFYNNKATHCPKILINLLIILESRLFRLQTITKAITWSRKIIRLYRGTYRYDLQISLLFITLVEDIAKVAKMPEMICLALHSGNAVFPINHVGTRSIT